MNDNTEEAASWLGTEFELIGCAIEAVLTDEATREAGLWDGDMLPRALRSLRKAVAKYRPIPVSERLPEAVDDEGWSDAVLIYVDDGSEVPEWRMGYAEHGPHGGHRWRLGQGNKSSVIVTHWLPLPPKPE